MNGKVPGSKFETKPSSPSKSKFCLHIKVWRKQQVLFSSNPDQPNDSKEICRYAWLREQNVKLSKHKHCCHYLNTWSALFFNISTTEMGPIPHWVKCDGIKTQVATLLRSNFNLTWQIELKLQLVLLTILCHMTHSSCSDNPYDNYYDIYRGHDFHQLLCRHGYFLWFWC